jgi:putative ABC transport system permease protein
MIRHLFKLVWNRKRYNFLMIVEFFFAFLTLFGVILAATFFVDNYRHPLGFEYVDVWNVGVDMKQRSDDGHTAEQVEMNRRLFQALEQFERVEKAAGAQLSTFGGGRIGHGTQINGRDIEFSSNEVTDDYFNVMKLKLLRGRWFGKDDDGVHWTPVVVNQRLATELFGDEDPLGKNMTPNDERESRIIGVITDFRQWGEFVQPGNYLFNRKNLNDADKRPPSNMVLKMLPGTTRDFEEKLVARLQFVAKDWSFDVQPLEEARESMLKLQLAPLIAGGMIVGFLMLMVALGLTGVLWQNVTQRTKEIGLRRAKGATHGRIYTQILGELLIITSIGVLAGVLVVVQFPLLDLLGFVSSRVFGLSIFLSAAIIYLLTILCGLYPSLLATMIQPAEALHYE